MAMDECIAKAPCHCTDTNYGRSYENAGCMIHMSIIYYYNHFDWLILAYKMILSLWQAFQGLKPNGCLVYLKFWNLENINVLKTYECF